METQAVVRARKIDVILRTSRIVTSFSSALAVTARRAKAVPRSRRMLLERAKKVRLDAGQKRCLANTEREIPSGRHTRVGDALERFFQRVGMKRDLGVAHIDHNQALGRVCGSHSQDSSRLLRSTPEGRPPAPGLQRSWPLPDLYLPSWFDEVTRLRHMTRGREGQPRHL